MEREKTKKDRHIERSQDIPIAQNLNLSQKKPALSTFLQKGLVTFIEMLAK